MSLHSALVSCSVCYNFLAMLHWSHYKSTLQSQPQHLDHLAVSMDIDIPLPTPTEQMQISHRNLKSISPSALAASTKIRSTYYSQLIQSTFLVYCFYYCAF